MRATSATKAPERAQVPVRTHTYAHDPRHGAYGLAAAEALGLEPVTVYRTLVADVDGRLTVTVVPVERRLDLKALAAAVKGKRAQMTDVTQAERTTGYVAGSISPTRSEATVADRARRQPAVLVRLTNAVVAPISR